MFYWFQILLCDLCSSYNCSIYFQLQLSTVWRFDGGFTTSENEYAGVYWSTYFHVSPDRWEAPVMLSRPRSDSAGERNIEVNNILFVRFWKFQILWRFRFSQNLAQKFGNKFCKSPLFCIFWKHWINICNKFCKSPLFSIFWKHSTFAKFRQSFIKLN